MPTPPPPPPVQGRSSKVLSPQQAERLLKMQKALEQRAAAHDNLKSSEAWIGKMWGTDGICHKKQFRGR